MTTLPNISPSNRDLLALVRAWAAINYPGCPLEYISLHLRFLPVPIQLCDSPAAAAPLPVQPDEEVFVPTAFQAAILEELEGKAIRSGALGAAVGDKRRLFRHPGGLRELIERGMVRHHKRRGYYRPDAPPEELAGVE